MKNLLKKGAMSSEKRPKEEAKSEGNISDEEEFQGEIMRAIQEEEQKIQEDEEDVLSESDMSSLPSQTDEESVVAVIKSKNVHNNQLTLV